MSKIKAIIFDLDNVLYNEETYIFFAYKKIAEYLNSQFSLNKTEVYTYLKNSLAKKTTLYPRLFNDLLIHYFSKCDKKILEKILLIFATVEPNLQLYSGAEKLLKQLKKDYKLALLTNGRIEIQKNKIKLLGIENLFDIVIYAREFGKNNEKPSTVPYQDILKKFNLPPKKVLAIGDNPFNDFEATKKLGIQSVRILTGEFKNIPSNKKYSPNFTIKTLAQLPANLTLKK